MADKLKNKTISGMLWSSVGKFGTMGLQFVSNLVLARLLFPSDYGAIGMLHVFIAVSSIFVTAGFGSALIQKKNPSHIDYTSVFYWNLVSAIVFYAILFVCGPAIAKFYEMPELCAVLRVQSFSLIIQAFSTVQSNQLQKQLRFKELSIRNILATISGTVVAIIMAFCGYGVWSLVVSHLVSSIASVFLLWWMSTWRPTWEFSWGSLKELFSFGGLMALSSFVETIYGNIMSLILGKVYSPSDLGYYTQARKLEQVPSEALSSIVGQVSFPVFASLQDDKAKLKRGVRKNIKSLMYLNAPLMLLLVVVARPLILLLYGEKWEISIPYFRILCLGGVVYVLNSLNLSVIKSLGEGKVFFFVQLIKRSLSMAMIIATIFIARSGTIDGVFAIVCAFGLSFYLNVFVNAFVNKHLIGYGLWEQLKDIGPYVLLGVVIALLTFFMGKLLNNLNPYLVMGLQIVVYIVFYIMLSSWFRLEGYQTYKEIIKDRLSGFCNKR